MAVQFCNTVNERYIQYGAAIKGGKGSIQYTPWFNAYTHTHICIFGGLQTAKYKLYGLGRVEQRTSSVTNLLNLETSILW